MKSANKNYSISFPYGSKKSSRDGLAHIKINTCV